MLRETQNLESLRIIKYIEYIYFILLLFTDEYVDYMQKVAASAPNTPFYLYENDDRTGIDCE